MSVDPVGMTLGIPGLIKACAEIYHLTLSARLISEDVIKDTTLLAIEQLKFYDWLERAGFVDERVRPRRRLLLKPFAQHVLLRTLQDIKSTLESASGLVSKYEMVEGAKENGLNFCLPEKFWTQKEKNIGTAPKSLSRKEQLKRSIGISKRTSLSWAVVDKARFKKSLEDLRLFNENLEDISSRFQSSAFRSLPSIVLPKVLSASNLEQIVTATSDTYPELSICAGFKLELLKMVQNSNVPVNRQDGFQKSPLRLAPPPGAPTARRVADLKIETDMVKVIVEDKQYLKQQTQEYENFIYKRVDDIARLLAKTPKPTKFHILDCIGYVHNPSQASYSFLLKMPSTYSLTTPPQSLQSVLCNPMPALTVRFAMATSFATSLLYLHASGILHQSLASTAIIFFTKPSYSTPDLLIPYISGFDYARFSGAEHRPEHLLPQAGATMYTHPEYMFPDSQRYKTIYDIYSMGLLLFEIALWQPLCDIIPGVTDRKQVLRILLADKLKLALPLVGEIFTAVIARCLTGNVESLDRPEFILEHKGQEDQDKIQQAFVRNIVEQLERCIA